MKLTSSEDRAVPSAAAPAIILEAIVRQFSVAATYNMAQVTLAPHVLYTRHGELHVDAITVERDGKPPKEVKIGTFRLSGLGALRVTPRHFVPSKIFDPNDERYKDVTLMAVERS
ncbi:hypothetical protein [uncultured Sphingomonas sp.]|uniref:hypothetical protein n=1 Tax=uncultured Sphingomonas sp. TaxID=158754 RepID=UPI0035CC7A62